MSSNNAGYCGRALLIAGVMTGILSACAAPSAGERANYLDLHYGTACSATAHGNTGREYDQCLANAYNADRQRSMSQYNSETGRAGLAVLLLVH